MQKDSFKGWVVYSIYARVNSFILLQVFLLRNLPDNVTLLISWWFTSGLGKMYRLYHISGISKVSGISLLLNAFPTWRISFSVDRIVLPSFKYQVMINESFSILFSVLIMRWAVLPSILWIGFLTSQAIFSMLEKNTFVFFSCANSVLAERDKRIPRLKRIFFINVYFCIFVCKKYIHKRVDKSSLMIISGNKKPVQASPE